MNKVELGEEGRIRALEARTTTWLRVAVVQQVLLVGLLASVSAQLTGASKASKRYSTGKLANKAPSTSVVGKARPLRPPTCLCARAHAGPTPSRAPSWHSCASPC